MKVVIGLGNPGSQYERTRHNIGWMVLDRLADRAGLSGRQKSRDASVTVRGRYQDLDLALVKPTTYMNLSGVAVRKVLARDHVPLEDMLVVVDDFDLPLGRLRLREEGSAGTHNGLRSIVAEMGTQKFPRLRVGIGGHGGSAIDHVLSAFAADEQARPGPGPGCRRRRGRGLGPRWWRARRQSMERLAAAGAARRARRADRIRRVPLPASGRRAPGTTRIDRCPDAKGIVRTRTGWRRLLPTDGDAQR